MGSHVNRKVGLTSIPSRTLIADQPGLAVVVKLQVIFQMLLGCEIFSTLRTVEWTVSCVLVHVNSQMGFLNKSFVTDGTLMRSVVCVQHHVFGKNSSCDKTFSTLGTHMTLGPVTGTCMNSCNVLCNMGLLSEPLLANRAPVGFFTRMSQEMFLQL